MNTVQPETNKRLDITYRPIKEKKDMDLLYQIYRSTRIEEMGQSGWTFEEVENFIQMQFQLQHTQYMEHYNGAAFDIIIFEGKDIGRLYVDRWSKEIRIIDIALIANYRRKGIGSQIMGDLIKEADEKNHLLSLHVEHNNPAMGLYKKMGFEKIKEVGVYYLMERKPNQ